MTKLSILLLSLIYLISFSVSAKVSPVEAARIVCEVQMDSSNALFWSGEEASTIEECVKVLSPVSFSEKYNNYRFSESFSQLGDCMVSAEVDKTTGAICELWSCQFAADVGAYFKTGICSEEHRDIPLETK